MHTEAAQRFVSMMMSKNHPMRVGGSFHRPIMVYDAQKRNIGRTRRRSMSKTTMDIDAQLTDSAAFGAQS